MSSVSILLKRWGRPPPCLLIIQLCPRAVNLLRGGSPPGVQLQGARVSVVDFPGGPKQDALSKAQVEPEKPSADLSDGVPGPIAQRAIGVFKGR